MKTILQRFGILAAMLVGLPLAGVVLTGKPAARYLEFPPHTQYIEHAGFSWTAFALIAVFTLACILPFIIQAFRNWNLVKNIRKPRHSFPWWGWVGIVFCAGAWILAWNRFPWFAPLQPHTFTPLWFGFIIVINALTCRRKGSCMMLERPRYFLALFPVSAVFWWFFEYLNRYVQNWHYLGGEHFSAWEYFWYATPPFSTVLPAVLSTREWLSTFSIFDVSFRNDTPVVFRSPRLFSVLVLLAAATGLALIGILPNYLFPLLWVSPLLIIVSLQTLAGERHIFSEIEDGDWRPVITSALAALICGFFWEMWNLKSMARWVYTVPFVNRFHIFEMPILGYAGYLPFGVECAVIGGIVEAKLREASARFQRKIESVQKGINENEKPVEKVWQKTHRPPYHQGVNRPHSSNG